MMICSDVVAYASRLLSDAVPLSSFLVCGSVMRHFIGLHCIDDVVLHEMLILLSMSHEYILDHILLYDTMV